MFDNHEAAVEEHPAPGRDVLVDASRLNDWTEALAHLHEPAQDDTERVEKMAALETLKRAAAAAQAELSADFDASMRDKAARAGVGERRQGRGVAEQIGLARRESPHRAKQHLGMAKVLRAEMPHTRAAFARGSITERAAMSLVAETACLDLVDRREVDRLVAGDAERLRGWSEKQVIAEARKAAARLDPAAVAARRAKAEKDRRVTIRPAPDTMTYLTGHLPVDQGVSVYAALKQAADRAAAAGDERSRSQIMADTLVARVTGQVDPGADTTARPVSPVAVNLVVSDRTLLAGSHDPAHVEGYGPIPADLARSLVTSALGADLATWLRKVYAGAHGGLTGTDSKARLVPPGLARLIRLRDGGICRTPWCDAPIRHVDHATAFIDGGTTTEPGLQGLCEACNHAKQAPGWSAVGSHPPGERHRVVTTTPTGHTYTSTAPSLPTPHAEPPDWARTILMQIHHGVRLDYMPVA